MKIHQKIILSKLLMNYKLVNLIIIQNYIRIIILHNKNENQKDYSIREEENNNIIDKSDNQNNEYMDNNIVEDIMIINQFYLKVWKFLKTFFG